MKNDWAKLIFTVATGLISIACCTQQPASSPTAGQDRIAPGTLIQVEMTSDIDVKKVHAGDPFKTKLWEDVRSGGKIVLPQKTMIVGHVVAAQPRSKDNPESKLTIAFDKAVLKDGSELPLRGVVVRVQLSSMAAAAAVDTNGPSYNPGLNPGSTTNIAMPNASGSGEQKALAPGPTNIRDGSISLQADAQRASTVIVSTTKTEVKLKHYATLDVQITHAGE